MDIIVILKDYLHKQYVQPDQPVATHVMSLRNAQPVHTVQLEGLLLTGVQLVLFVQLRLHKLVVPQEIFVHKKAQVKDNVHLVIFAQLRLQKLLVTQEVIVQLEAQVKDNVRVVLFVQLHLQKLDVWQELIVQLEAQVQHNAPLVFIVQPESVLKFNVQ